MATAVEPSQEIGLGTNTNNEQQLFTNNSCPVISGKNSKSMPDLKQAMNGNGTNGNQAAPRRPFVVAVEDEEEDIIPGPPVTAVSPPEQSPNSSKSKSSNPLSKLLSMSTSGGRRSSQKRNSATGDHANASQPSSSHSRKHSGSLQTNSHHRVQYNITPMSQSLSNDRDMAQRARGELDISLTEHRVKGNGILASRADLNLAPEEFAAGCNLLQAAAAGELARVEELLQARPHQVNFRDYDRRTALHVAASEGHLEICKFLVLKKRAKINRSDRWGGSPLDDAHRHRHQEVVNFLRQQGAVTGSGNQSTNLITAAAEGDVDEVQMLLASVGPKMAKAIVTKGDYDKRTPLHLAASEGHTQIVLLLCKAGADVNAEDRWGSRPLDDALKAMDPNNNEVSCSHEEECSEKHNECVKVLKEYGAAQSPTMLKRLASSINDLDDSQRLREDDNLKVDFEELEMVDRIGSGAFGEIFKCRWRGTMVAAKCIKSAKIRQDWINKKALESIEAGEDVDDAMRTMDEAEMDQEEQEEALSDFRQEISVLKSLRHPHIVLLLAFSTTENYEVMISELMECSLLDVFKAHLVHGTRLAKKSAISYAIQLARGMNYLHTCKPPVIHRDLKPANLLLDHTGVLKISDFGLARVRPDPKNKKTNPEDKNRFMTGETGSYRFMAPEVYRHEDYNETVDVYSYSMILYYLLDGRPPWPTLNGLVAVKRAAEEGDRPIIPRNWDQRLTSLLMECWDENRSARPPFKRIIEELDDYSHDVFRDVDITKSTRQVESGCNCTIM